MESLIVIIRQKTDLARFPLQRKAWRKMKNFHFLCFEGALIDALFQKTESDYLVPLR